MSPISDWPEWRCPEDGLPLHTNGESMTCGGAHAFPIRNAIPRFVPSSTYADHFGAQWNRYRLVQLDSYMGRGFSEERLRRCSGEDVWSRLSGMQVLECGCGAGRFTEVLLSHGARVTSIDLSTAVDANVASFPDGPSHRVAQADITRLPFAPMQFQLVVCLGVIQHTPNPERTIEALYNHVAPGGSLIVDHYTDKFGWYTRTAPLFNAWLKRLPTEKATVITERLVDALLPLHKGTRNIPLVRSIVGRLSPLMTYYVASPELPDPVQREMALLDTHDSLTDWYKHFRTREQIRGKLQSLGMKDIWCDYGGNGVEGRGKRPA
jgi:SAM-dependent methyltransferase